MKYYSLTLISLLSILSFVGCKPKDEPKPEGEQDPANAILFTETLEEFANPERGMYVQVTYDGDDLTKQPNPQTLLQQREAADHFTLYLHIYDIRKYVNDSVIEQDYLDRFDRNMQALRDGGVKTIIRFHYSDGMEKKDKPWDATPEIVAKHIDQFAPYIQKNADVIATVQAGFIGSWGEWYYTDNFVFNPKTTEQYKLRKEMLLHLLDVVPSDRQVAVRVPDYKTNILNLTFADTLLPSEAYQNTYKARIACHNDAFNSSANDLGTYNGKEARPYWGTETKYTWMGGESAGYVQALATGSKAIERMVEGHYDYIHRNYYPKVLNEWISSGYMPEIRRRLGYRFVLDKAWFSDNLAAGKEMQTTIRLHNVGFASPKNARDVELVISNGKDTYIFPQTQLDPRTWMAGEKQKIVLKAVLPAEMKGTYQVYLNLPDPYQSLHTNPHYSIRFANENVWDAERGYNLLGEIKL